MIIARFDVGGALPPPYRYSLSRDQNVSINNNDDNKEDEIGEHDKIFYKILLNTNISHIF